MENLQNFNYNEFDSVELYINKDKAELIKGCYSCFGYTIENEKDNKSFSDTLDVTLSRPHNIPNKDELQLLQVYLEDDLNSITKLENTKNAKSDSLLFASCFLGALILVLSINSLINLKDKVDLIVGIMGIVIAIVFIVVCVPLSRKIKRKEEEVFSQKYEVYDKNIKDICTKARNLLGVGENGKE